MTRTGNISIPKKWREELGIAPDSSVVMHKLENKIVIEPLKKGDLHQMLSKIDEEMRTKKVKFSQEEAVKDALYD